MAEIDRRSGDIEDKDSRGKDWMVTYWGENPPNMKLPDEVGYYVYGHEYTDFPEVLHHIHIFIQYKVRKRFHAVKDMFGVTSHVEKRQGTVSECRDYCMKDGFEVEEWGIVSEIKSGSRSDLSSAIDLLDAGSTLQDVAREMPVCFSRYMKNLCNYQLSSFVKEYLPKKRVEYYWGSTGTGKTRMALKEAGESVYCLTLPTDLKGKVFFDGYCGQRNLILDDFIGQLDFRFMLTLLD